MTDDRYKQIMADLGMPNSRSLLQALQKVANEVAQEQQATVRRLIAEAVERERERLARDVAELHMAQTVNHQEFPRAWHDGVDAALAVIQEWRCSPPAPTVALTEEQIVRLYVTLSDACHDAPTPTEMFGIIARAAVAKFCEVNGLGAPEAGKEGGA